MTPTSLSTVVLNHSGVSSVLEKLIFRSLPEKHPCACNFRSVHRQTKYLGRHTTTFQNLAKNEYNLKKIKTRVLASFDPIINGCMAVSNF